MHRYTAEELSHALQQSAMSTVKQVPVKIEVQSCRQWWLFGRKGYRMKVRLINERGNAFRLVLFVPSLLEVCTQLGIGGADAIWQHTPAQAERDREREGWTPFMFF